MSATRKRIAQMCAVVAGAAMFLPWNVNTGISGTGTLRGVSTGVGRIVLAVCIVTIVLVQIGWRPAWIGVGLAAAFAAREIFDPSGIGPPGQPPDPGVGVWIAVIASAVAGVLLVWEMFAGVAEDDGSGPDEPPRWFFSGPLGRRR